jgi:hypothetical protein
LRSRRDHGSPSPPPPTVSDGLPRHHLDAPYRRDSCARSHPFGEGLRAVGSNGILFDSAWRDCGCNLIVLRPGLLVPLYRADCCDRSWTGTPEPVVVRGSWASNRIGNSGLSGCCGSGYAPAAAFPPVNGNAPYRTLLAPLGQPEGPRDFESLGTDSRTERTRANRRILATTHVFDHSLESAGTNPREEPGSHGNPDRLFHLEVSPASRLTLTIHQRSRRG